MHTGAARIHGRSAAGRHMYSPHLDQSAGHDLIASATGTVARRLLHRSRDRRHCGVCERSRCENLSAGCGLSACADSYRARSPRHGRRERHGSRQHEPRLPSGGRCRQRCSLLSTGLRGQTTSPPPACSCGHRHAGCTMRSAGGRARRADTTPPCAHLAAAARPTESTVGRHRRPHGSPSPPFDVLAPRTAASPSEDTGRTPATERRLRRCEHCVSTAPRIIGLVDADAGCSGDGRWHAYPSSLRRRWRWVRGRRIVTNNGRKRRNESSRAFQHACLTFSSLETRDPSPSSRPLQKSN